MSPSNKNKNKKNENKENPCSPNYTTDVNSIIKENPPLITNLVFSVLLLLTPCKARTSMYSYLADSKLHLITDFLFELLTVYKRCSTLQLFWLILPKWTVLLETKCSVQNGILLFQYFKCKTNKKKQQTKTTRVNPDKSWNSFLLFPPPSRRRNSEVRTHSNCELNLAFLLLPA